MIIVNDRISVFILNIKRIVYRLLKNLQYSEYVVQKKFYLVSVIEAIFFVNLLHKMYVY